jgi:hypothetical protein
MQKIRIPMRRTAIGTAIPMPIFAPVDKLVADSRDILVPELVGVLVAMVGLLVDSWLVIVVPLSDIDINVKSDCRWRSSIMGL